jgi:hypothetical protein
LLSDQLNNAADRPTERCCCKATYQTLLLLIGQMMLPVPSFRTASIYIRNYRVVKQVATFLLKICISTKD